MKNAIIPFAAVLTSCAALAAARTPLPPGAVPPKPWLVINEDNDRYFKRADLPGNIEKTTAEVKLQQDAAADVAALSEKIVASFDGDALPGKDDTILFPIAKPRHDEPSGAEDMDATRPIKLADLKFGRNYNGEDDGK